MESALSPSASSFSRGSLAVPGGWVQGWGPLLSEGPEAGVGVGSGKERRERRESMPESYWLSSESSGPFCASDMPAALARGGLVRAGSGFGLCRTAFPGCGSALQNGRPGWSSLLPRLRRPEGLARSESEARRDSGVYRTGYSGQPGCPVCRPASWALPPTGASGLRPRPPESPFPRPLHWLGVRGYPVLTHW